VHAFSPHTLILAFLDSTASASDAARACAYVRRALESTQPWGSGVPRPLVQRAPSEFREADRQRLTRARRTKTGGQAVSAADEI